jgi:hypothetical protein
MLDESFLNFLTNGAIFGTKILNIKREFLISLHYLFKVLLVLRRI